MLLSENSILKELGFAASTNLDVVDFLDEANSILESNILNEAEYNKVTEKLHLEILDVERFVKVNSIQQVSNPRCFIRSNIPSDDGLMSNSIFGLTRDDRASTYAYIDLHGWFLDPSCYKAWCRIDSKIANVVHGINTYRINDMGQIVEDDNGETGIDFLRKNLKRIKFTSTASVKRDIKVKYLEKNRDNMFIRKYIVIPAYWRDTNTSAGASRTVGLSGINKLYNDLIVATNALDATQDYMFDASDSMKARVQEIVLCIYDWFAGTNNKNIKTELGSGIAGKFGVLRRTNMSKTSNFSSRLVISAPELKVEKPENMMVDFDKSAVPLAATMAQFRDFIVFHVKKFFEMEFIGSDSYPVLDKNGEVKYYTVQDPMITFSEERIKHEMERYLHGYNNRFVPVEVPLEETEEKYYMQFKGIGKTPSSDSPNPESIYHRRLTWCDIFYIAAVEATKDKQLLITRFPIFS